MAESRRLRTQAERDADGTTWYPGGVVRGKPIRVELDPDECVLVIREGVGVMCVRADHQHNPGRCGHVTFGALGGYKLVCVQTPGHRGPHQADNGARWSLLPPPPADRSWIHAAEPRRRWWHQYTRRTR